MKKILLVVFVLAAGILLALLLRRPSAVPAPLATVPVIRKSAHDMAPIKHVTTVPGLYAGHHHPGTKNKSR